MSGLYRQGVHRDLDTIRDEYLRLREKILRQLQGSTNAEHSRYLHSELEHINHKLGSLQGFSSAYIQRQEHLKQPVLHLFNFNLFDFTLFLNLLKCLAVYRGCKSHRVQYNLFQ